MVPCYSCDCRQVLATHVIFVSLRTQLFSTILDYAEAGEYDKSDGSSLRPFIERHETNVEFDEDVVFAEWCVSGPGIVIM